MKKHKKEEANIVWDERVVAKTPYCEAYYKDARAKTRKAMLWVFLIVLIVEAAIWWMASWGGERFKKLFIMEAIFTALVAGLCVVSVLLNNKKMKKMSKQGILVGVLDERLVLYSQTEQRVLQVVPISDYQYSLVEKTKKGYSLVVLASKSKPKKLKHIGASFGVADATQLEAVLKGRTMPIKKIKKVFTMR